VIFKAINAIKKDKFSIISLKENISKKSKKRIEKVWRCGGVGCIFALRKRKSDREKWKGD
jgi:hypothetical protein